MKQNLTSLISLNLSFHNTSFGSIIFVLFFLLSFLPNASAQNLDSLYGIWQDKTQSDSIRVQSYKEYIWDGFLFSQPDSAFALADAMHRYGLENDFLKATNQAYTLQGIALDLLGDYTMAMEYYQKSLNGSKEIDDKWGISEVMIAIGTLYELQGNYPVALEYYNKALDIDEEIGNKGGLAMSLNNIGNIFTIQGDYAQALAYYKRALAIDEELGVKQGIAVELSNIGSSYEWLGETDKALEYFNRALSINTEIEDLTGIASSLISLGDVLWQRGDDDDALQKYEESLSIYQKMGNRKGVASVKATIGRFYFARGDVNQTLKHCSECFKISKEIGAMETELSAHDCLYKAYKSIGDDSRGLFHFEQKVLLNDSIYNEENTKELTRIQMQYEFQRKEAAIQAEQDKKDAFALQELERQKLLRNAFIGGFALVLLFAGVVFKQRNKISKEKERSEELLLNILPADIAEELKQKGKAEARNFDMASIIFTDFKGFTEYSAQLSATDLVHEVNVCFQAFDAIIEKYGIEKIKTIGDAYMAAGGLPVPSKDSVKNTILAALEMQDFIVSRKAAKDAQNSSSLVSQRGAAFEMRVGVHTGPVVAGIVGVKKFQYDIWGDTVNTAARMESHSEVGKVNISQATFKLLMNDPDFVFESRGKIEAKGKGEMEMFFVSLKNK